MLRWKSANPEKRKAQVALNNAIRDGRIIRPDTDALGHPNPEGHHEDYSKPLMVTWACKECHKILDAKRRQHEKSED